ncbi:hypothetical protein ACWCXB_33020 [Streptomyces sp. NPDC001514]
MAAGTQVPGQSLAAALDEHGPLPLPTALQLDRVRRPRTTN